MAAPTRRDPVTTVVVVLAVLAFAGSGYKIYRVAVDAGQDGPTALSIALTVEALALAAGIEIKRRRAAEHPAKWPALVLLGMAAFSLAANVKQAPDFGWGLVVAAFPPVAFLLCAGMIETRRPVVPERVTAAVLPDARPARVRPPADRPAVTPPAARSTAVAVQETPPADGATPIQRRREREAAVAQYLTDNPGTTVAGMARALQIPRPTVADIVGKLPTGAEQETA